MLFDIAQEAFSIHDLIHPYGNLFAAIVIIIKAMNLNGFVIPSKQRVVDVGRLVL